MRTSLLIAMRELSGYFSQPIAYIVLGSFLVLCGAYTFLLTPFFVNNEANIRPFFEFCPFIMTLVAPAITMRTIAEDRRRGMLELLHSWPIGDFELVLGKFLGALGLVTTGLAFSLAIPLTVSVFGELDWGPIYCGYIGLFCMSAAYLSVGLLASALTHRQIIAFILGFGLCFGLFIVGEAGPALPNAVENVAHGLSFRQRFVSVTAGVLDLRDLAYFISVSLVCLGISAEILHSRHWRR